MAQVELRHLDCTQSKNYVTVEVVSLHNKNGIKINIYDESQCKINPIILDISTAIRLSKTIRTNINIAKKEVNNE